METRPSFDHHPNSVENQRLSMPSGAFGHHPQHPLFPVAETEIDGIEMGVLSDGTPYLNLRGLARMCGIDHSGLLRLANGWGDEQTKPRGQKIRELLLAQGHPADFLYMRLSAKHGEVIHAFPDAVCMAVLEYYAFEATTQAPNATARHHYRLLARQSFRKFVYDRCGYTPGAAVSDQWRQFHDRVSLTYNAVPPGYFGVFGGIADMLVALGERGLYTDQAFVPDISVGKAWSKHWTKICGDGMYGPRRRYDHDYPDYFPQSVSNPQEPWCYPEQALGEFKRWIREDYIGGGQLRTYLSGKVRERHLAVDLPDQVMAALAPPAPRRLR